MLHQFYGPVIIRLEAGKVTHVEAETRRMWEYRELPPSIHSNRLTDWRSPNMETDIAYWEARST